MMRTVLQTRLPLPTRWEKPIAVGLFTLLAVLQLLHNYVRWSPLSDYSISFYPAAQDLFRANPYGSTEYDFFYPIWLLIPILPLTLLPVRIGNAVLGVASVITLGTVTYKLGAKPLQLALFLLLPQVLFGAKNGDYMDVLTAVGFVLPPRWGLFFVLIKPQAGIGVAVYWLFEAWREGGWKQAVHTFAPVGIAYALILLVYSPNLFDSLLAAPGIVGLDSHHNAAMWPFGAVIGAALLAHAVRTRRIGPAILSSACFTPYVGFYSWPTTMLGLLPGNVEFLAATLVMWAIGLIEAQW